MDKYFGQTKVYYFLFSFFYTFKLCLCNRLPKYMLKCTILG